jgi:hypothetical protein
MKYRERLWQHFIESGNPMSYIAYRKLIKKDAARPFVLDDTDIPRENI